MLGGAGGVHGVVRHPRSTGSVWRKAPLSPMAILGMFSVFHRMVKTTLQMKSPSSNTYSYSWDDERMIWVFASSNSA